MNRRKKILVVEDEKAMREIVAQKLDSNDFTVIQAEDGKQAIELWIEQKPDLTLLDLLLPKIDGFAVLKTIRENPDEKIATTPVIVLSNIWNKDDIKRIQELKIENYLIKIYNTTDDVLKKITEYFKKSR